MWNIVLGSFIGFCGAIFGSVGGVRGGGIFVPMITLTDSNIDVEKYIMWNIVLGSFIGFCGATFRSVGGVGGGGIFVPMVTLIIGFDPKSAIAISKSLLIQPMLMLRISIGVAFEGTSTKTCYEGVDIWNKETVIKKEAAKRLEDNEYKMLPGGHNNRTTTKPERALKEEWLTVKRSSVKDYFPAKIAKWVIRAGLSKRVRIGLGYVTSGFQSHSQEMDFCGRPPFICFALELEYKHSLSPSPWRTLADTLSATTGVFSCCPLPEAIKNGQDQVVLMLVEAEASLDMNNAGNCLCMVVAKGDLEFVTRVLANGNNPNLKNYDLRTPLHIVVARTPMFFQLVHLNNFNLLLPSALNTSNVAIHGDKELDMLIKGTIAGGGVIPHIHKSLINRTSKE
ncbi:sulfite exporter TauE/SafE family protein 3-like protein [Tanacetum coccineum]